VSAECAQGPGFDLQHCKIIIIVITITIIQSEKNLKNKELNDTKESFYIENSTLINEDSASHEF
jgi:hypothetical protein